MPTYQRSLGGPYRVKTPKYAVHGIKPGSTFLIGSRSSMIQFLNKHKKKVGGVTVTQTVPWPDFDNPKKVSTRKFGPHRVRYVEDLKLASLLERDGEDLPEEVRDTCLRCGGTPDNPVGCIACCRDCGFPCDCEKDGEGFHVGEYDDEDDLDEAAIGEEGAFKAAAQAALKVARPAATAAISKGTQAGVSHAVGTAFAKGGRKWTGKAVGWVAGKVAGGIAGRAANRVVNRPAAPVTAPAVPRPKPVKATEEVSEDVGFMGLVNQRLDILPPEDSAPPVRCEFFDGEGFCKETRLICPHFESTFNQCKVRESALSRPHKTMQPTRTKGDL